MSRGINYVKDVVFLVEVRQEQCKRSGLDGKLTLLLVNSGVEPSIVFLENPLRLSHMGLLHKQIHE